MANTVVKTPPIMRPELKRAAASRTPRSLRAFVYQLNQEDWAIASAMNEREKRGPMTPHNPAILSSTTCLEFDKLGHFTDTMTKIW